VRAAAAFLDAHRAVLPKDTVPTNSTQLSVLALEIHDAFLQRDEHTGAVTVIDPDVETVRVALARRSSTQG
jgi:hypothetical protein